MMYRIAEPAPGGRGVLGIFPEWGNDGGDDARILHARRDRDISVLFTRNYSGQFIGRIGPQLLKYGSRVDVACGWETEKLRLLLLPLNPAIEFFRLSAMNFNSFDQISSVRQQSRLASVKEHDIFFAASHRPDGLKNVTLLNHVLTRSARRLRVVGYGRLSESQRSALVDSPHLDFHWRGKSAVDDPRQRRAFLTDLVRSRCLLVASRAEGYCRLIGEALLLGVPVLLYAEVLCENWVHLDAGNCRMFTEATFDHCLDEMLSRSWEFQPPVFADGNAELRRLLEEYFARRCLALPLTWYPLGFGAFTDRRITADDSMVAKAT